MQHVLITLACLLYKHILKLLSVGATVSVIENIHFFHFKDLIKNFTFVGMLSSGFVNKISSKI